ncbi:type II secretion system F family protein [Amnibacterium sp. CER49]|uniref:type II secretion system F family protein n=1 Tax=Amnibacterium sp. CER49 TaxID=3039161 RepID=UPI00244CF525|nr:type II secretion system F family protein [Amnibacterium sp. CER49]MDH2445286.1 type II secretion system F family protein [Amnibacterium sp. CER49]
MSGTLALAAALGALLGLGLWSLASRLPSLARPRLAARLAPFLLDVSPEARRIVDRASADPVPVLGVLAAPALDLFQHTFGGLLGGTGRTALLLRRAGNDLTIEAYRLRQLLWTLGGAAAAEALAALHGVTAGAVAPLVAAPLVGAGAGLLLRDRLLVRAAGRRTAQMESELPTVLEFLALCLAAGEGVHDALRRVADVGSGRLAAELRRVLDEVGVGVPLATALARLADDLRVPSLTRCLAHVVGALDRGSPLAELLRVQAVDAREESRRALLESSGKKEITMLLPLVFLILPVTVAFAVWPGFVVLQTQL